MYAADLGVGKTMNEALDGCRNLVADLIAGLATGIAWLEQVACSPEELTGPKSEA